MLEVGRHIPLGLLREHLGLAEPLAGVAVRGADLLLCRLLR